jgi:hypothetical protein
MPAPIVGAAIQLGRALLTPAVKQSVKKLTKRNATEKMRSRATGDFASRPGNRKAASKIANARMDTDYAASTARAARGRGGNSTTRLQGRKAQPAKASRIVLN